MRSALPLKESTTRWKEEVVLLVYSMGGQRSWLSGEGCKVTVLSGSICTAGRHENSKEQSSCLVLGTEQKVKCLT